MIDWKEEAHAMHLKYLFLKKKRKQKIINVYKISSKTINIWICRNNPIVKIKSFIPVVLSSKLPALRRRNGLFYSSFKKTRSRNHSRLILLEDLFRENEMMSTTLRPYSLK